jgi:hypothetical protein
MRSLTGYEDKPRTPGIVIRIAGGLSVDSCMYDVSDEPLPSCGWVN